MSFESATPLSPSVSPPPRGEASHGEIIPPISGTARRFSDSLGDRKAKGPDSTGMQTAYLVGIEQDEEMGREALLALVHTAAPESVRRVFVNNRCGSDRL